MQVGDIVNYGSNYAKVISIKPSINAHIITTDKALGDINNKKINLVRGGISYGTVSHSEGYLTTATGDYSHAEGKETTASDEASHAEGWNTTASGSHSHAEGEHTKATKGDSHAEGYYTTASGENSHAEGKSTTALGNAAHAGGNNTVANAANQTVIGQYNALDTNQLFIVGNGDSTTRKNVFTVSTTGTVMAADGVQIKKNSSTD